MSASKGIISNVAPKGRISNRTLALKGRAKMSHPLELIDKIVLSFQFSNEKLRNYSNIYQQSHIAKTATYKPCIEFFILRVKLYG